MIKTLSEIMATRLPPSGSNQRQFPGLIIGTNFFPGFRPTDAPVNCVGLYLRAQTPSYQVPNYTEGVFLFEVRNDNYYHGKDIATKIKDSLNGLADCRRVMVEDSQKTLTILSATVLEFDSIGQDPNGANLFYVVTLLRYQEKSNG